MLAFSNDYYGFIFRVTQSVELFCTYDIKEVNKEHEAIFATLQRYVKLNLVVPVGEEHMYYAAIHHKACKLTTQGQHYWNLVKKNTI